MKSSRRNKLIIGAAVIAILVLCGTSFYLWDSSQTSSLLPCPIPSAVRWVTMPNNAEIRPFPTPSFRGFQSGEDAVRLMEEDVQGMELSPDGKYLAVYSDAGISMHQANTFELTWAQPSDVYRIAALSFSPDGSMMATGTRQSEAQRYAVDNELYSLVTLWDTATGEKLHEFDALITNITWSPDSKFVALVTGSNSQAYITLYDTRTGKGLYTFKNASRQIAWSPDTKMFAVGSADGIVEIHDIASGNLLQMLPAPNTNRQNITRHGAGSLFWSPDGEYIGGSVSFSYPRSGYTSFLYPESPNVYFDVPVVWEVATQQVVFSLESGTFAGWSPDGTHFRVSDDAASSVWNIEPVRRLCSFAPASGGAKAVSLQWTEDGNLTVYRYRFAVEPPMFMLRDGTLVSTEKHALGQVNALAWSPDGNNLAAIIDDIPGRNEVVVVWKIDAGQQMTTLKNSTGLVEFDLAWSPDGSTLVTTSEGLLPNQSYTTYLWDADTGKQLSKIEDAGVDVAWSPDGKLLAVLPPEGRVILWNANTGEVSSNVPCGYCMSFAWSPDGALLATTANGYGAQTHIWDIKTGQNLEVIPWNASLVAWSPDGQTLAIGSDALIHLWSLIQHREIGLFSGSEESSNTVGLEWSPDGNLLAVSFYYNNQVFLLDGKTGELLHTFKLLRDSSLSLAWSPDGQWLASGSTGSELILIDMSEWIDN